MESIDYWRFCDELNVFQAALLILDVDPSSEEDESLENYSIQDQPKGYQAVLKALRDDVLSARLPAKIRFYAEQRAGVLERQIAKGEAVLHLDAKDFVFKKEMNWHLATVSVNDLKEWLTSKGYKNKFFFPDKNEIGEPYLDPKNKHYAPKLAAAVNAWQALNQNPELYKGKSIKKALDKWLNENASHYGLTTDEGLPMKDTIDYIAKVANWNPEGGSPATPMPTA